MASRKQPDAAAEFLRAAGDNVDRTGKLVQRRNRAGRPSNAEIEASNADAILRGQQRRSATDDAESGVEISHHATPRKRVGINLKSVAEALQDEGLDLATELTRVLPELDLEMRTKVMMELLQYTQPKLRSTEVKATVDARIQQDLSEDQAKRIAAEVVRNGISG